MDVPVGAPFSTPILGTSDGARGPYLWSFRPNEKTTGLDSSVTAQEHHQTVQYS